jgi:hypothetical protein
MPVTRRRRANPPEQPENNNPVSEQQENGAELFSPEQSAASSQTQAQDVESQAQSLPIQENIPLPPLSAPQAVQAAQDASPDQAPSSTMPTGALPQPFHAPENAYSAHTSQAASPTPLRVPSTPQFPSLPMPPFAHTSPHQNGEHFERPERAERFERTERVERMEQRQEYPPAIEGGRRTARGELFRRPPQPPVSQPMPMPSSPPLQAPSHEITLPLGNLLHLAYNPAYTGSDEARSALLHKLSQESKAGGRARCWSCGSLAIVYDRWNTRSKTFGEVGIAFCEICGVWSVL